MFQSRRNLLKSALAAAAFGCSGCKWLQTNPFARPPQLPPKLPPEPTLAQVIEVVNANNGRIESFSTQNASLSSPGLGPTLRANVALQRPRSLRMRADFMSSPEIDLGSNEQGFWFWTKRGEPPAVYWCRHESYATSPAREMIPIEPLWLVDALGLAVLDPSQPHQGPTRLPGNRLQIDTAFQTAEGPGRRIMVLDAAQGWILEQRLLNAQGMMLAASNTGNYQQDYLTGLWMARTVQIQVPPAKLSFRLDLGQVRINQLLGDPAELWAVPQYPGAPLVDIGRPPAGMQALPVGRYP